MTQINICEPLRPAKTGYVRSWTEADRAVNKLTGDPVQPSPKTVKQKVSGIEYNIYNDRYQRSLTTPKSYTDKNLNKDPIQPDILSGWNGDYIKKTWWNGTAFEYNVSDMSEEYVKQTLYRGFYIDAEKLFSVDNEYVSHDICGQEVYLDGDVVVDGNGVPVTIYFVENATLCLEDDRDNIFKTEFSFQAIQLEDNTSVSHIDYTGDYLVREEGDIALSMEEGNLIEPYGL